MSSPELQSFRTAVDAYRAKLKDECAAVRDLPGLEDLRNRYLSRKRGFITTLFEDLKKFGAAEKPVAGQLLNGLKVEVQEK
jgi:phenylalanyl-tRNA synthetase alpha subunit